MNKAILLTGILGALTARAHAANPADTTQSNTFPEVLNKLLDDPSVDTQNLRVFADQYTGNLVITYGESQIPALNFQNFEEIDLNQLEEIYAHASGSIGSLGER